MTSPYDATAAEQGYPLPQADKSELLPPAKGGLALPHFMTFSSIVNYAARTYRYSFDEALRHNQENARASRRDTVVFDALRARQIPTAQLEGHVEADDENNEKYQKAASELTNDINSIPRWQALKMHLLEAEWFGRYAVQLMMSWDYTSGRKKLKVRDHKPIHGDKLVFTFGGETGVLVHGTYDGEYRITERGKAHFFTPAEREAIIVHQHETEDSDFYEPDLGGAIHGVGIRSRIYWLWWLRQQVQSWLMDYLERCGAGGFTIYYYDAGNTGSLTEVKQAAEEQFRNNTILFPRRIDNPKGGSGVERVECGTAGAQLLEHLCTEYFDSMIRRAILGQTLSSGAEATGMGSEVADLHEQTLSRIIKYDAINLGETLTSDLVRVLAKYNHSGCENHLKWVFDVDKPNAKETLEAAQILYEMGAELDADELRSIAGLTKPQPGHAILAKVPPMNPTTMGLAPVGVPGVAPAGPQNAGTSGQVPTTSQPGDTAGEQTKGATQGQLPSQPQPSGQIL